MDSFITILIVHVTTTALGALYVRRRGVTPVSAAMVAIWAVLFFPVAYNVMKFL